MASHEPKSLNVGAAIMKQQGLDPIEDEWTPEAEQWRGWGTALKPSWEIICVARKPLAAGTVATNVLRYGTGALNIAATRIGMTEEDRTVVDKRSGAGKATGEGWGTVGIHEDGRRFTSNPAGRWPANVALDHTSAAALDQISGETVSSAALRHNTAEAHNRTSSMGSSSADWTTGGHSDSGGASRFFLTVDPDPLPIDTLTERFTYTAKAGEERVSVNGVSHPTVKPLALMRWLVRLVTPPNGVILEPFAGSGTTVEAVLLEGFRCIAIEREPDYLPLITQRINRRRDPLAYIRAAGEDLGLFDEIP